LGNTIFFRYLSPWTAFLETDDRVIFPFSDGSIVFRQTADADSSVWPFWGHNWTLLPSLVSLPQRMISAKFLILSNFVENHDRWLKIRWSTTRVQLLDGSVHQNAFKKVALKNWLIKMRSESESVEIRVEEITATNGRDQAFLEFWRSRDSDCVARMRVGGWGEKICAKRREERRSIEATDSFVNQVERSLSKFELANRKWVSKTSYR
jgi:hypothetical protein